MNEQRNTHFRLINRFNEINEINLERKKDCVFVFRLWVVTRVKYIEYFEIYGLEDGKYNISKVESYSKNRIVDKYIQDSNWKKFNNVIQRNDILRIPDESLLKWDLYRKVNGELRRIYILHGQFYFIHVFDSGKFNKFAYHDPWSHSWSEAKRVGNILTAFSKLCKDTGIAIKQ